LKKCKQINTKQALSAAKMGANDGLDGAQKPLLNFSQWGVRPSLDSTPTIISLLHQETKR
jgi:hypothetical protein